MPACSNHASANGTSAHPKRPFVCSGNPPTCRPSPSPTMNHGSSSRQTRSRRASRVPPQPGPAPLLVLTIGHSTRPIDVFVALLHAHGVTKLVDVRTVPRSKHNPQFNQDQLPASLAAFGIAYEHQAVLGGLRRASQQSPNQGWRNASFRGYADHMQTPEFQAAVERLITQTQHGERLALMCAEAVPWRCHRSLIADALLVRGVNCEDIRSPTQRLPLHLTRFAQVRGTEITYPSDDRPTTKPARISSRRVQSAEPSSPRRRAAASEKTQSTRAPRGPRPARAAKPRVRKIRTRPAH